jgi:hypothetical protein
MMTEALTTRPEQVTRRGAGVEVRTNFLLPNRDPRSLSPWAFSSGFDDVRPENAASDSTA